MNLKHLTDKALLADTLTLASREREVTNQILHHLREIDRRKLFSDLKCSSLFDYCTRILNYSEGSAHRRIQASRLLEALPEIEEKIESGSLSLMNLSRAATFFKQEGITAPEAKIQILTQLEGMNKKECEKTLFEISGKELPAREEVKRLSQDKTKVSMVLTDETLDKLTKFKGLIGRNLSNEELISRMADIAITVTEKKKFKLLG